MTKDDVELIARDAEIDGRWDDACTIRAEAHALEPRPINPDECSETPLDRGSWDGRLISLDGASTDDFVDTELDEILAYGETAPGWDGNAAGVLRLKDGRFVAWESDWGPTGSGFSADAYGGTADIAFAHTPGKCLEYLSEKSRELLKWY